MSIKAVLVAATFLFMAPALAGADPLKLQMRMTVAERYNDNVFFNVNDAMDDFITVAAPGIRGGWETEVTELRLTGRADFYRYREHNDLDAVDQSYTGQLNRKWSPRLSTGLTAGYLDDERPERELSETGLLFSDDRRQRQTCGLNAQYLVSELTTVSFGYNYSSEEFDDRQIYDLEVHTLRILLTRRMVPLLDRGTGRLQLIAGRYEYDRDYGVSELALGAFAVKGAVDDTRSIDYYSVRLGLACNWSERFQVTADLGVRLTRSRRTLSTDYVENPFIADRATAEDEETWGYVAMLEGFYHWESGTVGIMGSHDVVPSSGREGASERTTLRLSGRLRMPGDWDLEGSAHAFLNRSEEGTSVVDEDELTVQLRTGVRYAFNRCWSAGAHIRRSWIQDREMEEERSQNILSVQVQWNWPVFE